MIVAVFGPRSYTCALCPTIRRCWRRRRLEHAKLGDQPASGSPPPLSPTSRCNSRSSRPFGTALRLVSRESAESKIDIEHGPLPSIDEHGAASWSLTRQRLSTVEEDHSEC